MHGLINRSIQLFVVHTQGPDTWARVTQAANLDFTEFEAMMQYDDSFTPRLVAAMAEVLDRPGSDVMEDFGIFIVSDAGFEPVRRLLRFGGIDFVEFLHSLDDLDERVRLAVPDLTLPKLELTVHAEGHFSLTCDALISGYGHVMIGLLRAMADDYGALVLLDHQGSREGGEVVSIRLVDEDYSEGRTFELGAHVA